MMGGSGNQQSFGDTAGREAGRMRQDGRMWIIWPKDQPLTRP